MKQVSRATIWFSLLAALYILLGLVLPANTATMQQFHLTPNQYKILNFLVSIPAIMAWSAAFYGYGKLEKYADAIKKSKEGKAFQNLAVGIKYLAWGLPLTSIFTVIMGAIAHGHPGFIGAAFILSHYVNLVLALAAFSVMCTGTQGLASVAAKAPSQKAVRWIMGLFVTIAVLYCYGTLQSVKNQNNYHLPVWLILLTMVIPYLYAWLMGLLAAYEISLYRKHVPGILYKHALNFLTAGLLVIVMTSIGIQYFTSGSPYLRRINFTFTAVSVYALLVLYVVGFALLIVGANRLNKIEEV